ncbi:MAG: FAD-dependent oxidoreductase [Candidatus Nanohaloarchaea archaeon]
MGKQIVVVGGGIAGLETVLRLERELDAEITLVEPRERMNFYPSSHKIIEGAGIEDTTIEYDEKFSGRDIKHVKYKMTGLKSGKNIVELEKNSVNYDKLVLAFGVETNFYGTERKNSYCLRSIKDLKKIREDIESGIEDAVVVGGGATGVEASASLDTVRKKEGYDFDIKIIQSGERLLPSNTEKTSRKVERELQESGIEIKKGVRAEQVKQGCVECSNGDSCRCDLVIWAAGVKKRGIMEEIDISQGRKGVEVNENMEVEGEDDIYAVGDISDYGGKANRAYYALSEAKTAAKNIKSELKGNRRYSNSFFWDPQVIYLGGRTSVLEISGLTLKGLIPHIVREYFVDERYMLLRKHLL